MQASDAEMRKLGQRLEETDARQRQMMTFLAKAVQNPAFLQQILASRQQNLQRIDSSDMKGAILTSVAMSMNVQHALGRIQLYDDIKPSRQKNNSCKIRELHASEIFDRFARNLQRIDSILMRGEPDASLATVDMRRGFTCGFCSQRMLLSVVAHS